MTVFDACKESSVCNLGAMFAAIFLALCLLYLLGLSFSYLVGIKIKKQNDLCGSKINIPPEAYWQRNPSWGVNGIDYDKKDVQSSYTHTNERPPGPRPAPTSPPPYKDVNVVSDNYSYSFKETKIKTKKPISKNGRVKKKVTKTKKRKK